MADKMLDPTSLEARMKYGRPEDAGSIEATEEGVMDRVGRAVQETAEALGLSRAAAQKLSSAATFAGENAPITGDVNDAYDVKRGLEKGEYGDAAVASLGFVPVIGGALRKGADATMEVFRRGAKEVQEEALAISAKELGRIPNPDNPADVEVLVLNARDVERKYSMQYSADTRPDIPQGGNEPVSFGRGDSLYHGTGTDYAADKIEEEGLRPSVHGELRFESTSTSRDPIYAGRHFAKGDSDRLFEVTSGREGVKDLPPQQYQMLNDSMAIDTGDVGVNIPKTPSFASEHETALFGISRDDVNRLRETNPEKAEFIQEGMDKAEAVTQEQLELLKSLKDVQFVGDLSPADAKRFYNGIRDNMKEALSLAKYTEDNSARGTYDWYIRNWSSPQMALIDNTKAPEPDDILKGLMDEDPSLEDYYLEFVEETGMEDAYSFLDELGVNYESMGDVPDVRDSDVIAGLEKVRDSLTGEQPKAELDRMIRSIEAYDSDFMSVKEFGEVARQTKQMDASRPILQDRKEKVKMLTEMYNSGELSKEGFDARVKELTQNAKAAMGTGRKEMKDDPLGFIPTAERMNTGGLVG